MLYLGNGEGILTSLLLQVPFFLSALPLSPIILQYSKTALSRYWPLEIRLSSPQYYNSISAHYK